MTCVRSHRDTLEAQHISPEGVGSKEGHIKGLLLREMAQRDKHGVAEPHVSRHLQPDEPVACWRLIRVQYLAWVKELTQGRGFVIALASCPPALHTGTPDHTPGHPGDRGTWSGQKQQKSEGWRQKHIEVEREGDKDRKRIHLLPWAQKG